MQQRDGQEANKDKETERRRPLSSRLELVPEVLLQRALGADELHVRAIPIPIKQSSIINNPLST
jgi:hypothetical protein